MAEEEIVHCPLCHGHGRVSRTNLVEAMGDPDARKQFERRIAELLESGELSVAGPKARDFQKEVHSWNPTLPIWRRSPKE